MFTETETLRVRLHQLRLAGHSLADLLQFHADRLDASGDPPARSISDELQGYREQFSHLTSLFYSESDVREQRTGQSREDTHCP